MIWTYDVEFVESPIKWASRWDTYLYMADDQIHWSVPLQSLTTRTFTVLDGAAALPVLVHRPLQPVIPQYSQRTPAVRADPARLVRT